MMLQKLIIKFSAVEKSHQNDGLAAGLNHGPCSQFVFHAFAKWAKIFVPKSKFIMVKIRILADIVITIVNFTAIKTKQHQYSP